MFKLFKYSIVYIRGPESRKNAHQLPHPFLVRRGVETQHEVVPVCQLDHHQLVTVRRHCHT